MSFFTTPPIVGHNESYLPPIAHGAQALQITMGPLIMGCLLVWQYLKRKMQGKCGGELHSHIWKFVSKAEARDKTGRIVQYGCRAIQGFMELLAPEHPLLAWKKIVAEVQTTLAWARRTNRWGKELPHIPVLGEAFCSGDILEFSQRAVLITFLVQDHIYWLLKVGIFKFEKYSAIQWHRRNLRFITLSHVLNFSLCLREVSRIRERQRLSDPKYSGSEQALKKAESDVYDNRRMMLRYVLTFFQMLHVSQVKKLHDSYVGIFGMLSSYIDASKQW